MFQDFDLVVLDEVVLVAQRYRQDVLAAGHDDDVNREKRHAAYRQFILWNHGIWELVTEGLFPVVVCGKLETNIRTGLASTVALWEEDLDKMNGSCITFKY